MSNGPFINPRNIWECMDDEGIGVGHVHEMKMRASERMTPDGQLAVDDVSYVIGDDNTELVEKFMSRISSGHYVRACQTGVCGDGE